MSKVVIVEGEMYTPGFPACAGCDELAVGGNGWECSYRINTDQCKYPEKFTTPPPNTESGAGVIEKEL